MAWDLEQKQRAIGSENERRRESWRYLVQQIGTRYAKADLADWRFHGSQGDQQRQRAACDAIQKFMQSFAKANTTPGNLMLYGPVGTGKDLLLSVVMAHATLERGLRVAWQNGTAMYGRFRDSMRPDSDETSGGIMRSLIGADVLAISDPLPPVGNITEFQASTLFEILDGRYRHRRPTWVTLNVANRDEAASRMSPQLIDRLAHGAVTVFCNWPSYREFEQREGWK